MCPTQYTSHPGSALRTRPAAEQKTYVLTETPMKKSPERAERLYDLCETVDVGGRDTELLDAVDEAAETARTSLFDVESRTWPAHLGAIAPSGGVTMQYHLAGLTCLSGTPKLLPQPS